VSATTIAVLLAQLVSTGLLTGIIWTVQVVHYPLMAQVGADEHVAYAKAHAPRMAAVVMLPWSVQGASVAWLLTVRPDGVAFAAIAAAAVAAATTVVVTLVASIPAHGQLQHGPDAVAHRRLVRSNWLRTAAWTTHLVLAVGMLLPAVRAG
jgi:hypothetical protein